MRILIVNTRHYYAGGDSIYSFNLAENLRSKGHKIAFFAMEDVRNFADPNADLFVSYIDFQELNGRKSLNSGLRVLGRAIYSWEARAKFRQLLGRFRPDVVHLQNIHAHITPSVVLEAREQGIPVVWTLHDYKIVCPNSHFLVDATGEICEACGGSDYLPALRKKCKKGSFGASVLSVLEAYSHRMMGVRHCVQQFLTPSLFMKNKLVEKGVDPQIVTHLPLFLQEDMFRDRVEDDHGYILFLGRLDHIKGIYLLLEAASLAPDVPLWLAGSVSEPLASRLNSLLPDHARYVGMKNREEVKQLLYGARALVLPSLCYENQPLAILETFAAGKPVIASDLGGMTELIKKSGGGLLFPPGEAESLAYAMRWMLENPAAAREMGQRGQRYAIREHSPEVHYTRLKKIYDLALNI